VSATEPGPGPIEAIAFDWGGVFTEGTFDGRAVVALADLMGLGEIKVAASYYPLMEDFEVGAFDLAEFSRRLQAELATDVDPAELQATFLNAARERPAMYGVLAQIPAAYTVGMLSNNVPTLCDRVRSDPRMARVEHFVFSNEIGVRKPDQAAFAALREALAVAPEATLFVDDNADNIAACRALGFKGLLLDSPDGFARTWRALLPELGGLVDGPEWEP
jgi:putative hydrolase of the HAD superfamily